MNLSAEREPAGEAQHVPQRLLLRVLRSCGGFAGWFKVQTSTTVTGTLILPAEKEPQVHQLCAALSICIPEVQQIAALNIQLRCGIFCL